MYLYSTTERVGRMKKQANFRSGTCLSLWHAHASVLLGRSCEVCCVSDQSNTFSSDRFSDTSTAVLLLIFGPHVMETLYTFFELSVGV